VIRGCLTLLRLRTGWFRTWGRGRAGSPIHTYPAPAIDRVEVASAARDWLTLLAIMDRCASAIWHAGTDDDFLQFHRAADRMTLIARQLIAGSPMDIAQSEPLDLNQIIAESHGLLIRAVPQDISLRLELGSVRRSRITATRWDLERLLLHLVLNASRHIDTPGAVLIQTSYMQQVPGGLRLPHIRARPYVRLIVSDSGTPSMTPTRTIRPVARSHRQSADLRLSTVARLVKQLDGVLHVESDSESQTRIRIDFPLVADD